MLDGLYLSQPYGQGWFYPFHRGAVFVENPVAGLVGMVPVGMFDVGSVILQNTVADLWHKGDEVGHFASGGSAIVLLFGPTVNVSHLPVVGDMVRMGSQLGTL